MRNLSEVLKFLERERRSADAERRLIAVHLRNFLEEQHHELPADQGDAIVLTLDCLQGLHASCTQVRDELLRLAGSVVIEHPPPGGRK
jgi:hypothetical protein